MTNLTLVVLKIWVSTNFIPGWSGSADPILRTNQDGSLDYLVSHAILIIHPPKTIVVTNYAIGFWKGTNAIELMTLTKGEE